MDTASAPSKMYAKVRRVLYTIFSRVYLQSLTMTFLAEWGDRSQLATVVLAARDIWGTCVGGTLGHAVCTGLAVVGGRIIAQRISVKTGDNLKFIITVHIYFFHFEISNFMFFL